MMPPATNAVAPRVWSRRSQCALAAVLFVLFGLLAWAVSHTSEQRPLELQKAGTWRRIDLNEADYEQLRAVPGIDDVLARRILEYRQSRGRFQSVDELDQVKGIGTTTLATARKYFTVNAPAEKEEAVTVALGNPSPDTPRPTRKELPSEPLDLNTATLEQLQKLPGIGRVLAQRIVDAREQTLFRSVEDLLRVKGIGETTLKNIKPYVKVVDRRGHEENGTRMNTDRADLRG